MKKVYTFCIAAFIICTCGIKANALTVIVTAEDFHFDPATFNINLGDTIRWQWDNSSAGPHTTTSTAVPVGAAAWNQQLDSVGTFFIYVPTVAGTYAFHCDFHFTQGMVGSFTVSGLNGTNMVSALAPISLNVTNPFSSQLQVSYYLPATTAFVLRMYDILGNARSTLFSSTQQAGMYTQAFSIPGLTKGIYFISLETADGRITQKILIQ